MSEQRTEIAELGEFGLIDHLTKNFEIHNASTVLGVGDDAAVIDHFGKQTVVIRFGSDQNFFSNMITKGKLRPSAARRWK